MLARIWNLRRSPHRRIRVMWWGAILFLILLLAPGPAAEFFLVAWSLVNAGLLFAALGWGLFHPRAVLRAGPLALRWAFWVALVASLTLSAYLSVIFEEQVLRGAVTGIRESLWFLGPFLFLLLFGLSFVIACTGAAIGAFAGRDEPDLEDGARRGTQAIWLVLLLLDIVLGVADATGLGNLPAADLLLWGALAGLPWLTHWTSELLRRPTFEPRHVAERTVHWLARRLVWRWSRGGRVRTLDARGAAIGLVAAVLALLAGIGLLMPLQTWALVSLVRFRNSLEALPPLRFGPATERIQNQRERIVLLEMDTPVRRDMAVRRSEAALQAEMIRRLQGWGAAQIVLPLPMLHESWLPPDWLAALEPQRAAPLPEKPEMARSVRDLPALEGAIRAAGNVVLAVPRFFPTYFYKPTGATIERLARTAGSAGLAHLDSYRSAQLPAISTAQEEAYPGAATRLYSLPVPLFAAARGAAPAAGPVRGRPDQVMVAGVRVPQISGGKVLVDLLRARPGRDFPRVSYSTVLHGEPAYGRPPASLSGEAEAAWTPPERYFRGKIVILDSPVERSRETLLGPIPQAEALAYAGATLLSGSFLRGVHPAAAVLWTLLTGVLVGHLCGGRTPLQATLRLGMVFFLVLLLSAWVMLFRSTWIDPVAPAAAALGSFLLVTQLTFALERDERERNRNLLQRFVAPQVIEELLDDPERRLGLGGTRQKVCILFADVRNFTQFAEQHTPEEVIEATNTYLTAMTEALHAHGGLLDKYTGDGLMAIFRVTGEPEEDVARAVRAALAMSAAAASVSTRLAAQGRTPLPIGIGMHYGEAVVGLVGNPNQFNYTALGHAVIIGQRLQSIAAGGEVVVSESVHFYTSGTFQAEAGEPVYVKGLSAPVRPYRVLASQRD
jgi:class 3 adenylate cyclase